MAELAAHSDLPVNIALFGPWGSGKTSLYNLIEMSLASTSQNNDKSARIKTIRYDAWKFGGASLKRNFVAQAAEDLKVTKEDYRETLYENVSFIRIPLRAFWITNWARTVWTIVTILGIAATAIVGWSLHDFLFVNVKPKAPDPGFWTILADHAKDGAKLSLASAIPVLGGLRLLESARVSVSRDAPSQDEEFERAFHDLIDRATTRSGWWERRHRWAGANVLADKPTDRKTGMTEEDFAEVRERKAKRRARIAGPERWDRVLFFVDELDRCAPDDVLATLVGVKTFLEHDRCVFVVAADRDVLVEALEVPSAETNSNRQVTPLREDAPYYSTAGAFIDKMFQHQIDLPPLRRHALTTFAKKVVAGHSDGIWFDLERTGKLDDVIWTLIPLHVQSPRRIKVLLNNFATTARIASARGIQWRDNPIELAKLTVLRTEFPRFAQDLLVEPKLVRYLQEGRAPGEDASGNLRRLYDIYAVDASAIATTEATTVGTAILETEAEEEDAAEFTSTGPNTKARRAALARAGQTYLRQLHQYLEKAAFAGAVGPSRALLYMENVGDREGLSDPDLSDAIDDAPDRSPDITVEAFEGKPDDAVIAIPILAGEVSNQIGPGKQVLTTVICGLAEGLDDERLDLIAGEAAAAVEPVLAGDLGTGSMMAGGIAITNSPKSRTDPTAAIRKFGELVVKTDENFETLDLPAVNLTLEFLTGPHFETLSAHLAEAFNKGMDGVEPGLIDLSGSVVDRYWDEIADTIFTEIAAMQERQNAATEAATPAASDEPKDAAKTWFMSIVHALKERNEPAEHLVIDAYFRGMSFSPTIYAEALSYAEAISESAPEIECGRLGALGIQEGPTSDWPTWSKLLGASVLNPQVASAAIQRVLAEVDATESDLRSAALDLLERLHSDALPDPDLGPIAASIGAQLEANPWTTAGQQSVREFAEQVVTLLAEHNPKIIGLYQPFRGTDIVRVIGQTSTTPAFTNQVLKYLHTLAGDDIPPILEAVDAAFPTFPTTTHGMRLLTHLKTMVPGQAAFPVAALTALSADFLRNQTVNDWLRLDPPVEDLVALAESGFSVNVNESVLGYVGRLSSAQRASLWTELLRIGTGDTVLEAVAGPGVMPEVAQPFLDEALFADRHQVRRAAVSTLLTLPLHDDNLVAATSETIYGLTQTGKSGDVKLAGELAIVARDIKGGHKTDVKKVFDRHRGQFSTKQQVRLTAFRMLSPRKGIADRVEDFVRSIFG